MAEMRQAQRAMHSKIASSALKWIGISRLDQDRVLPQHSQRRGDVGIPRQERKRKNKNTGKSQSESEGLAAVFRETARASERWCAGFVNRTRRHQEPDDVLKDAIRAFSDVAALFTDRRDYETNGLIRILLVTSRHLETVLHTCPNSLFSLHFNARAELCHPGVTRLVVIFYS